MGLRSDFRSILNLSSSFRVAGYKAMGILTRPKLILPFQIARITVVPSHLEGKLRGRRWRKFLTCERSQPASWKLALLYAANSSCVRGIPRSSNNRISVSSIKLLGQEAPAVIPTTTGPGGNQ